MLTLKQELDQLTTNMYRGGISYDKGVAEFKRKFIVLVLEECRWNQGNAARLLNMHRNTLSRTMAALKIKRLHEKKPPARVQRWAYGEKAS